MKRLLFPIANCIVVLALVAQLMMLHYHRNRWIKVADDWKHVAEQWRQLYEQLYEMKSWKLEITNASPYAVYITNLSSSLRKTTTNETNP